MLKIEAQANMKHLNIGSEGQGEGKVSRIDLKFTFSSGASLLTQLMALDASESPQAIFWSKGEVLPGLESIKLESQFKHNTVKFGGVSLGDCKIKNITLEPLSGNSMLVTLTAQHRHPGKNELATLVDWQKESSELIIESDPDLFDQEQTDNE